MENPADFEVFVKRLIKGARDVLFRDVIMVSTGFEIVELSGEHLEIVKQIKENLNKSLDSISDDVKKNFQGRANEISNYLEHYFKVRLNNDLKGIKASIPKVGDKKQSAGYPDLIIEFDDKKYIYLEIKTYQHKTIDSNLRSFYFKPSENNKISESCPHILIGFEVDSIGKNNRSPFIVKSFKIVDLYNLKVDLKPEFNANNPSIYKRCKEI